MQNQSIRVLSFDPGLTLAGWAVLDYNLTDGTIIVHRFGDISPSKIASRVNMSEQVEKFGKRIISLDILEDMVKKLYDEYKPDYVASEDAFFCPATPNAFASLLHWLNTIELLLFKQYQKPLVKISPRSVKQCITGSGGTQGKLPMHDAIMSDSQIVFKQKKSQEEMNEHSVDAISVGVCFIRTILLSLTEIPVVQTAPPLKLADLPKKAAAPLKKAS